MTPTPPLPLDLWNALPAEPRALIQTLLSQVQTLQAEVAALRAQLDLNSSRPPSSDPPHVKRQPPRPTSKRKRGGQPGHQRAVRPRVPPEQLTGVVDCVPEVCSCGACLTGTDPAPHPHQVAELPQIRPDVIEYRLHRLVCLTCNKATRATLPPGVPTGAFGPRLLATIALLTGRYRLGKRPVQAILADLMGLSISTGMVSKAERRADTATTKPVAEVAEAIAASPALNVEETGWREAQKRAWLWTAVAPTMTLFRIDRSRGAAALRRLVGEAITPTITSDRFATYQKVPRRQVCWAHLRRDFQAMIDRGGWGAGGRGQVAGLFGPGVRGVAEVLGRFDPADDVAGHGGLATFGGAAQPGGRAGRPVPVDGPGVPSVAEDRTVALDVRVGGGGDARQQRGGAGVAARGDLAEDQRRDRQ